MEKTVESEITMVSVETKMSNVEANRAIGERLANRIKAGVNGQRIAVVDTGSEGVFGANVLSSGLVRVGMTHGYLDEIESADTLVIWANDSAETAKLLERANEFSNIVICQSVGPSPDAAPWVAVSKLVAQRLGGSFSKDMRFTGLDGVAMMSLYHAEQVVAEDYMLKSDERIAELEFALSCARIANTTVSDPDSLIAQRDERIAELEERMVDAMQRANVAQDTLAGANAEKARADGVAAELDYQAKLKDAEIDLLIEELDGRSGGFKQAFRSTKVGSGLAKATRPFRRLFR